MSDRPLVVGLTGGIGSGKSAVANLFAELGADVIDTDVIAHALTARRRRGDARHPQALRRRVRRRRRQPGSRPHAQARLRATRTRARCSKRSCTRMIRSRDRRRDRRIDRPATRWSSCRCWSNRQATWTASTASLVVDCTPETQIARVMQRSGLAREEVRAHHGRPGDPRRTAAAADDVIDNEGPIERLRPQVERLHAALSRPGCEIHDALGFTSGPRLPDTAASSSWPRARVVISYEFPLNERIRTLLRLEDLYDKIEYFVVRGRTRWSIMSPSSRCSRSSTSPAAPTSSPT